MTGRSAHRPSVRVIAPAFLLSAVSVICLSAYHGGYYPRAWGWATLVALAVAAAALALGRARSPGRAEWLTLAALALLVLRVGLSAIGQGGAPRVVPELERGILYFVVLWTALITLSRRTVHGVVEGIVAGTTVVSLVGLVSLLTSVGDVPDGFEGRLLFEPLGYANAMGGLIAMGLLLTTGLASRPGPRTPRACAAAALVPLGSALVLTESRGAVAALGLAALLTVVVDPARARLVATSFVVVPVPALAAFLCARSNLTDDMAAASALEREASIVGAAIALLTVAAGIVAFGLLPVVRQLERRLECHGRRFAVLVLVVAAVGLAAAAGGVAGESLGDRTAYWQVAWDDARAHPLLGSGAGSFRVTWLRERDVPVSTRDAHNLYLETLAELGPVGLALLLTVLFVPVAVAVRVRRRALVPATLGAYAVFVLHAGVDWDWEMPAVTFTALLCAAVLLVSARRPRSSGALGRRGSVVSAAVVGVLAVVMATSLVGNALIAAAAESARVGGWADAERRAQQASRWAPWSVEPLLLLGEAQLARGDRRAAHDTFMRAIRRDGNDWRGWYGLARVSGPAGAQQAYRRLQRLDPLGFRGP